jgi:hypothetical protein
MTILISKAVNLLSPDAHLNTPYRGFSVGLSKIIGKQRFRSIWGPFQKNEPDGVS